MIKVFNLCRSYKYQSVGYYVSLLAEARGHKPLPSITTIQDMRQTAVLRIVSEEMDDIVQHSLAPLTSERFDLSIYFGRNLAKRYDRLAQQLFDFFPAPLLRAQFVKLDRWRLQSLRAIAASEIPASHNEFVIQQAQRFFARPRVADDQERFRFELAILVNPDEIDAPSDERAIQKFIKAAKKYSIDATVIGKQDYGRIAEFDALFIRETTSVNHQTYRFARRAEAEGLVVIDDPTSIVRCSNKVYQAELFQKNGIHCPKTRIVHKDNVGDIADSLGFPVVLKRPDSSFSAGVVKAENPEELAAHLDDMFQTSELVVAQSFVRSPFDWRVGVLNKKPLFVCRYHMARGHWQIQQAKDGNQRRYGKVDTLALDDAPAPVVELGVKAASLIGDGFYGVDIKEVD
ncbi:MAG: RimK family protein, partial [Polyangiales bacterium]